MKLSDALRIIQAAPKEAPPFRVLLACGYTPLHVQTFLAAHLQTALGRQRRVEVLSGLYGDVPGALAGAADKELHAIAMPLEWPDLDPRLGFRHLGGWGVQKLPDIVATVDMRLDWLRNQLDRMPAHLPVAIALPTTPSPPVFHTQAWQAGAYEMALEHTVTAFAAWAASKPNLSVLSRQALASRSPYDSRFDLKSELLTGLPFPMPHASAVGEGLARLIVPRAPKKGLITDLDDTLWLGIVGEIGADKVCWDLASHAQIHGLYQQVLSALAEQGALVAVASKNSPEEVAQAFERADLLISKDQVYPVEVHWNAKSESVRRILETWNIGADSVVFVDDSPMEIAEVQAAYPEMECILFPKNDIGEAYRLLYGLRDLFGKPRVSSDDSIRLASIRSAATLRDAAGEGGASMEGLLKSAAATITFELDAREPRVLELVNKTNQFNLNGIRYSEAEWAQAFDRAEAFVLSVQYEDKFGALGVIAVLAGRKVAPGRLGLDVWVMSCRAFSRRIEHQCLKLLFERFRAETIGFRYAATAKNGPWRDFLAEFAEGPLNDGTVEIGRAAFERKLPHLYHEVKINEWTTSSSA